MDKTEERLCNINNNGIVKLGSYNENKNKVKKRCIYMAITIKCDYCGEEYSTTPYLYNRAKTHCCSKECSINLKRMDCIKTNCVICNKEIIMSKSQYARHNHHCCSQKCASTYKHKQFFEQRKCEICEQVFECSKTSSQRFCSTSCQNKWQTTNIGEKNGKYKRRDVNCKYCGKTYKARAYKLDNQNLFCSTDCSRKWFNENLYQEEDWKALHRNKALNMLKKKTFKTETEPQKIINELLTEMKIEYKNEEVFDFYAVDNFLPNSNLIIEVMGDFWHTNPLKYPTPKQEIQLKRIPKDKAKHSFICSRYNIEILYLWETDIYEDLEKCKELIKKYIKNNGRLENYNSFNYSFKKELVLNDNIILAHHEK